MKAGQQAVRGNGGKRLKVLSAADRVRPIFRYIQRSIAGLSLAICAATLVFWARSHWVGDALWINVPRRGATFSDSAFLLCSSRGGLRVTLERWRPWERVPLHYSFLLMHPQAAELRHFEPFYPYGSARPLLRVGGFELSHCVFTPGPSVLDRIDQFNAVVPDGFIIAVTAVLPAWGWRRKQHARTLALMSGRFCKVCDYDLRGTPDRCPESGVVAPARN
jgi:hypothetical protein